MGRGQCVSPHLDDVRLLAQIETHLSQAGWHAITQSADALPFLAHDHVHRQDVLIRVAARHANVAASVLRGHDRSRSSLVRTGCCAQIGRREIGEVFRKRGKGAGEAKREGGSHMKVRPLQLITGDELSNGLREGAAQLTHAGDAGIPGGLPRQSGI